MESENMISIDKKLKQMKFICYVCKKEKNRLECGKSDAFSKDFDTCMDCVEKEKEELN